MLRLLLALVALGFASRLTAADKPNVVIFLIDDLGQRDLGCYGSTYYRTPFIDRLAKQGVRFTDAYAAAPVGTPSRAALLTGKHPARLNLTAALPGRPDEPSRKLTPPKTRQELPRDEVTLAEVLKANGYATALVGQWDLGDDDRGAHGFDTTIPDQHPGERLAAEAVRFLDAHRDRPFFLYLPHYAVRAPLQAPKELVEKYKPGRPGTQGNPTYAAMVETMDTAVGTVLSALDERKLVDNTVVIFTSGNGGSATLDGGPQAATYNGPLREGKGYLYEGGIRVPLVVRRPGAKAGSVTNAQVSSYDVFPTILELCGVKSDAKPDGTSFVAALKGEPFERGPLYWHYPHYANQGSRPGGAVRSGDWKLVEFTETGRRELFNLKSDPGESKNLSADKPDVVTELAAKLDGWRKAVGAKMPTPNPDYRPNPQAADGTVTLHARTADVTGVMLRYEPLPHKDTLGFWVRKEDTASWEFTLAKPGTYTVEVLQGCGKGNGGSEVEVDAGGQKLTFTVKDTGGFQVFEARDVGTVTLDKPGRLTLTLTPKTKKAAAVMDVRQVTLKPVKE